MRFTKTLNTALLALLLVAPVFIPTTALAQYPTVDITLVDNGNNELEVRVRPDGPFDGIFSALVFTVKWSTADNAELGAVQQVLPEFGYMPITKFDDQFDTLGYSYQQFGGFGFNSLSTMGTSWTANTEVSLMTVPVLNGMSTFEIVNDNVTNMYNGDYFVSLGGVNSTGVIYSIPTNILVGPSNSYNVSILPNPNQGEFTMEFTTDLQDDYTIELVNSVGQVMYNKQLEKFSGVYNYQFDLSSESSGVYFLKVVGKENNTVHRVVVK